MAARQAQIAAVVATLAQTVERLAAQSGPVGAHWHDHLARVLERIDGRWRTCIDGEHRSRAPAYWLETGPDGAEDLELARNRFTPADLTLVWRSDARRRLLKHHSCSNAAASLAWLRGSSLRDLVVE